MKKLGVLFYFMLALLVQSCDPTPEDPEDSFVKPTEERGRIFATYTRDGDNLDLINFNLYTHNIRFGTAPNKSGEVTLFDNDESFVQKCKNSGTIPMYSFNSGKVEDGKSIYVYLYENELMETFAKNAVAVMIDKGYEGIDLDWEHPDGETEIKIWNEMLQALRDEMTRRTDETGLYYYLSSAVAFWADWLPTKKTLSYAVDFINIMSYDYSYKGSPYAGHVAPLYPGSKEANKNSVSTSIEKWLDRGFKSEKLILGLAYYGYQFRNCEPYDEVTDGIICIDAKWNFIQDHLVDTIGYTKEFDEETYTTWYYSPDRNSFMGADDAKVTQEKVRFAKEKGLGGVFSWSVNLDRLNDGTNPLETAAYNEWIK